MVDFESLLREISPDSPTGENLEYDIAFGELSRAAEGTPEQSVGDKTTGGGPVNWKVVREQSIILLQRSKDLRIAILLARALCHLNGIEGLSDGLLIIRKLLETYWDLIHPQLDTDDNNDPTLRINTILTLGDREAFLLPMSEAPLVSAKGVGRFGLRDIQIARGDLPVPSDWNGQVPDTGTVSAAFMGCSIDDLKTTASSLASAVESIKKIDTLLMDKVGSTQAPDLSGISSLLEKASAVVNEYLAKRGVANVGETENMMGNMTVEKPDSLSPAAQSINGEINSREDAAHMMDKISEYYNRNEPSSPIPLLMQRAKRLSSLGFIDILKDIAPEGLKQAQNIGGTELKDD